MNISIHDNFLLSYSVNAEAKQIIFHTAYLDNEPHEKTDVVFYGVAAYHFECDDFQNILFDIEEVDIESIYSRYQDLFKRLQNHGWPRPHITSKETLLHSMQEQGVKGFLVRSSCGLDGWVWAQRMEMASV